jgi:hypothetical protein
MRSLITLAALGVAGAALPSLSLAQDSTTLRGVYANLGYAHHDVGRPSYDAIQGRLGYRFNKWVGAEGEVDFGLGSDKNHGVETKLNHDEAIYAVGFLPVSPKFDLLARAGYGGTQTRTRIPAASFRENDSDNSWNFGGGAQYHFDGVNGLRADYTRKEFIGGGAGHANVWSVDYSRRF